MMNVSRSPDGDRETEPDSPPPSTSGQSDKSVRFSHPDNDEPLPSGEEEDPDAEYEVEKIIGVSDEFNLEAREFLVKRTWMPETELA